MTYFKKGDIVIATESLMGFYKKGEIFEVIENNSREPWCINKENKKRVAIDCRRLRLKDNNMIKADLKTGMLVQTRNGNIYIVINDIMTSKTDRWDYISYYNYALLNNKGYNDLDIIKVSKQLTGNLLMPENWTEEILNDNLLWERKEVPEYTMEELMDKLGHEFKIKK